MFTIAVNDPQDKESGPTYYSCKMRKSGISEFLRKGKFVAVTGTLKVSQKEKDGKTYMNLDVWVASLDVPFIRHDI